MNKAKMTSKALKEMYWHELQNKKVFSIGYCTLSYLLQYQTPSFYTCGGYGWNYDSYIIGDCVINTGYRGMFGYSVDYNLSREYEEKARKIVCDWSIPYEEQRNRVNSLLAEYLQKAHEQA